MSLRDNHKNSPLVKLVYSQVTEPEESEKMGRVPTNNLVDFTSIMRVQTLPIFLRAKLVKVNGKIELVPLELYADGSLS